MSDRNTSINRKQLKPIRQDDLDATNSPSDGYVPSYDEATGQFTWVENTGGSSFANTVMVSSSGGDYTTIQGALDDNGADTLILVYPGTYTNDTINFSANNQCIIGVGFTSQQLITNTAQICNFGAYTGCRLENLKLIGTYTSAIDMITGSGALSSKYCHFEITASGTIAGSPRIIYTTGTFGQDKGSLIYSNTASSSGRIKRAIQPGTNGTITLRRVNIEVSGSGDANAIAVGYSIGSGIINAYRCSADIEDTDANIVVGLGDLNGSGEDEYIANDVHVICGGIGKIGYGFYVTSSTSLSVRSMYNHIHITDGGGSSYSVYLGANTIITSQFDDIIASDGYNDQGGNLVLVNSSIDGELSITNGLTLVNRITEFSTDGTLGDNSDNAVPTEKAVKTYVDNNLGASSIEDLSDVDFDSGTPTDNNVLTYDSNTGKWKAEAGGSGTPGGSDTQVQYNNGGSFGGNSNFYFDDAISAETLYLLGKIVTYGVWDADEDTGVEFDQGAVDEDKIRFSTGSYERWQIDENGHWLPGVNNHYDIGTNALPVRKAYINEIQLEDDNSFNGIDDFTLEVNGDSKLKVADRIEQNIMLNAFRIAVNGSLTQFNMTDGILDEYEDESGIDTVSSTNEEYDSSNDLYNPSVNAGGNDENTKLLLHCNGVDESTTFTDESDSAHTVTAHETAQVDTTNKKWGTGSLQLDGNSDYLSIPDSADWDLVGSNADNWTVDFWVKFNLTNISTVEPLISQDEGASDGWYIFRNISEEIRFNFFSATVLQINPGGIVVNDTDWHHIAFIKIGTEYALYVDGQQGAYGTTASIDTFSAPITIGYNPNTYTGYFNGYLDEIRIQHSNYFNASPNSTPDDTIMVPTSEYGDGLTNNMTLISNSSTAEAEPNDARIVVFEEDVDSITINTDLKAYVSKDGGSTWAEVTLSDEGNYEASKRILSGIVDLTASGIGSGTDIEYKLVTANNKDLKIHGASVSWD